MSQAACSACRAPLPEAQGFVFCGKCGTPQFLGDRASPFLALGAPRKFDLDEKALTDRFYELSKLLHPDRFSAAGAAARIRSQELSAILNGGYQALRQPEARLEALLRSAGELKTPESNERSAGKGQIPADLAEEFFELQEAMMEDETRAGELLEGLRSKLNSKREALTSELYARAREVNWDQPGASRPVIEKVLEIRRERSYVRSMLENLERMEEQVG